VRHDKLSAAIPEKRLAVASSSLYLYSESHFSHLQKPEKRGDATPIATKNDLIIVIARHEAPKQSHLRNVLQVALLTRPFLHRKRTARSEAHWKFFAFFAALR
jgi:hypothetical protein